jgi:site-specific recombinase XerD
MGSPNRSEAPTCGTRLMDSTTYQFRHAHATHAQQRGAPIALVRDTLGHTNIVTTGRYSHANPETSSGE